MSLLERPRLRPHLGVVAEDRAGEHFILHDQLRLSPGYLRLNVFQLEWVQLFDGTRTLRDIQAEVMRQLDGQLIPLEVFDHLVRTLEEVMFLDSPRWREVIGAPVRPPSCLGAYEAEPEALRRQLRDLFLAPGGAGLPGKAQPDDGLRAILAPHIDYARGGISYTHPFRELAERTKASLFVIVGTSHYSSHRFTLTRKNFETPLGIIDTDQRYIDLLVNHYGAGLFDDELAAHYPEHSIELEAVFLQYLFAEIRPIRLVPLLVGSFQDCIRLNREPTRMPDITRMIQALQQAESEIGEPICYIISGDLAHIGPKFRDPNPVNEQQLIHSRAQDEAILTQAKEASASGYFQVIAREGDRRRICGLPPTYLVLAAAKPAQGRVVSYDQYVHPQGKESVSFAGAVFER